MCDQTPRAVLALATDPSAARQARAFVRDHQCGFHNGVALDDALLLVSEMVTNAVLHGGPPVSIAVECEGPSVEIRVRDGGARMPMRRRGELEDEHGRGLLLMSSVAQGWGVEQLDRGKEVWIRLGYRR